METLCPNEETTWNQTKRGDLPVAQGERWQVWIKTIFAEFDSEYYKLANSVNTKCRPSKLTAIPFFKIIIDALGKGAHCFVSFFIINIEQLLSNQFPIDNSLMKYFKNNCEFHKIVT